MNELASHLADKFSSLFKKDLLSYNKVYLGVLPEETSHLQDSIVVIEPYLPGEFVKYVNNDGTICTQDSSNAIDAEIGKIAESFAHFTYLKSDKKLMVLDIQGTGNILTDPEVASAEHSVNNEYMFCMGNTTSGGIKHFLEKHICSELCEKFV